MCTFACVPVHVCTYMCVHVHLCRHPFHSVHAKPENNFECWPLPFVMLETGSCSIVCHCEDHGSYFMSFQELSWLCLPSSHGSTQCAHVHAVYPAFVWICTFEHRGSHLRDKHIIHQLSSCFLAFVWMFRLLNLDQSLCIPTPLRLSYLEFVVNWGHSVVDYNEIVLH